MKVCFPFTILFSINYHKEYKIYNLSECSNMSHILNNSPVIEFYSSVIFLILKGSKITEQPIMKQRAE